MRSNASSIFAVFALLGCYSEELPPELPPPDPSQEMFILVDERTLSPTCEVFGDELLWEGPFEAKGFDAPNECEPCECAPAACALPSKVTAHESVCPGDGAAGTLEAGVSWDGSCTAAAVPIQSDAFAAVTFEPPALAPCAPVSPVPNPARGSLRYVRACTSKPAGYAPSLSDTCYPPQENGECWKGYPHRIEFHMLNDTRKCSPCSCGAPSGGNCAVKTSLYQDQYCIGEIGSEFLSDQDAPICTGMARAPLWSMRSVFTQNEPGTCTPSTDSKIISGSLEPADTHVVCCEG
jgi:hypothetical protein